MVERIKNSLLKIISLLDYLVIILILIILIIAFIIETVFEYLKPLKLIFSIFFKNELIYKLPPPQNIYLSKLICKLIKHINITNKYYIKSDHIDDWLCFAVKYESNIVWKHLFVLFQNHQFYRHTLLKLSQLTSWFEINNTINILNNRNNDIYYYNTIYNIHFLKPEHGYIPINTFLFPDRSFYLEKLKTFWKITPCNPLKEILKYEQNIITSFNIKTFQQYKWTYKQLQELNTYFPCNNNYTWAQMLILCGCLPEHKLEIPESDLEAKLIFDWVISNTFSNSHMFSLLMSEPFESFNKNIDYLKNLIDEPYIISMSDFN